MQRPQSEAQKNIGIWRSALTGRGMLRVIPNAGETVLKRIIRACVVPSDDGTPVWSDEWPAYAWMDRSGSGYQRVGVNHLNGVWADALSRGSNAAEAIWGRCKADCKKRNLRFPRKPRPDEHGAHGAFFGECLWRLRNLEGPYGLPPRSHMTAGFWRLLATMA